jgi:Zn-finger nucleic acid-binding protein
MDLSGRGSAYRGATARCPACGEPMRTEQTSSAEVDVCAACGGMWVDWFDGDVHSIAVETEAARVERGTPLPPPPPLQAVASAKRCPRCSQVLAAEIYRFADAREDELVAGVEIHRCTDCLGAFVPRGSAYLLLDRVKEGPPMTLWDVVAAWLARVLAGTARR